MRPCAPNYEEKRPIESSARGLIGVPLEIGLDHDGLKSALQVFATCIPSHLSERCSLYSNSSR